MKKIISFALTLALLVSVFAALPVLAAETSLVGTDVTLTEGISLNFYIKADTNQNITNATPTTVNGVECYKLTVDLGAKNMGDELTAQLKNGEVPVGDAYTSSVKGYADRILASTYDNATVALVKAMLGYGAAAQNYFGYKTDALVGTPTSDTTALESAEAETVKVEGGSGVYIGSSLVLSGDMLLRFYFNGSDLNVTMDGEPLTVTNKNGYCYADVAVMPNMIASPVTVCCGDTTVTYSALNYLKSKMTDASLTEMVASIYAYGIAAEQYVRTNNCSHDGLTYDKVVQLPTLFNGGLTEGYCEKCGGTLTEAVGKTEADVKKYNPTVSGDPKHIASYSDSINLIDDVLGGNMHFYPHEENGYEGRALYLEFSFLYDKTLANNDKGYINLFKIGDEGNKNENTLYFINFRDNVSGQWCPYEGGFETGYIDKKADKFLGGDGDGIIDGPTMPDHASVSDESEEDYVFIGDEGWHRIGLKLHQEVKKDGNSLIYIVIASLFIDGECVSEYYVDLNKEGNKNYLYTARLDENGDFVYEDNDKNVFFYSISAVLSSSTYYVVTADGYATAVIPSSATTDINSAGNKVDSGFVLDVEPVDNPTEEDFVADGNIALDGTKHFKVKDEKKVSEPASKNDSGKKVLLISVDGLRPDAIASTKYLGILSGLGSYTLSAETISPSKTMPAHMSMFHSVPPKTHGMETNTYAPSANLGNGITEVLAAQGYTMAMFFDWENMQYLTKVPNNVERNYIQWYYGKGERYHERSTAEQTEAIIEHIENDPTDFTYLYFGMTDQMGHDHNWLSKEYYIAIEHIFSNIMSILEVLPEEYTVIITSDHGGGGDYGLNDHGSSNPVDMTTPVFIIGEGFEAGETLGSDVTILDIAPTIANILGAKAEDYWKGNALAPMSEAAAKKEALDLFLSEDAWDNYYTYGKIEDTTTTASSITMELSGCTVSGSSKGLTALQLNRETVLEMMSLGQRYLSFNVTLEAVNESTPPLYVDIYTYADAAEDRFFISSCDVMHTNKVEFYYANGSEVIIDLYGLYPCFTDSQGYGLIFLLSAGDAAAGNTDAEKFKVATNGGYITFGDVKFNTTIEELGLNVLFDKDTWGQYYKHGLVESVENDGESVTIGVTNNGNTDFAGTQLNKEAVGKMISLGFRYLSFTVNCKTGNKGTTPAYLCAYYYSNSLGKDIPLDFLLDVPSPSYDHYYADGDEVSIDLFKLYDSLQDGEGLVFMLSETEDWIATYDGSITLSNIKFYESEEYEGNKVLLVSIDGLSGSLIEQTDFNILTYLSAYTLSAQTINPSMTLPAHMSMIHGVTPTTHGVTKNTQVPSYSGNGIFETVSAAGLTSAMFYDWKELENLAKKDTLRVWRNYFCEIGSNKKQDFYASVDLLSNAAINHITNTPTDLTFLYYGLPDDTGENRGGWSSQNYIDAVNQVFGSLLNVITVALENEYTIIITADHGGGGYNGDNKHGSTAPEDMYIPLFIMDINTLENGAAINLGDGVSILDVAPTVADLLGIEAETYWVGRSLVSDDSVAKREDMATNIFFSEDAWADYDYGAIENTTVSNGSITMELSCASTSSIYPGMSTLQLTKDAIGEMISLGYHYLSFTMTLEGVEGGNTPNYVDVYIGNYNAKYNFHVSTPDDESPVDEGEFYYANGREVIVDLWVLYQRLTSNNGLIFALSAGLHWKATYGGRITFSDVKLAKSLSEYKSDEELAALDVFFNSNTWVQYSAHGKINSLKTIGTTLTVDVTNNGSTKFAGMQLSQAAVREMLDLGFTSLSFKMDYEAGSKGITPGYACVYGINSKEHQVDLDFLGKDGRSDYYYKDGERIEIDLRGLYDALLDGYVFVFVLTTRADWVTSGSSATTTQDGYFIFSNIEFS